MLDTLERSLLCRQLAVFACVLALVAFCVLVYYRGTMDAQIRSELSTLADSVISSIDFDDGTGKFAGGKPDSIVSALPEESARSLSVLRLQWYDTTGHLEADKGHLQLRLPFSANSTFEEQAAPHALVLTRPAMMQNKILGWVRVARPLATEDREYYRLLFAVIVGVGVTLIAISIASRWLVHQSIRPIVSMTGRLKQFTADASHELRNPLMIIKTNTDVALKYAGGMRDGDREKFEAIRSAADDMSRMTGDLLLLCRFDSVGLVSSIHDQSMDLRDLCTEIGNKWKAAYPQIELQLNLQEPLKMTADRSEMVRLFDNLICNAFQYTKTGGSVSISGQRGRDRMLTISIRDNGIGIADADLPHVFERFWRADKARAFRESGSGLGLAICKVIAESYKGTVTIQSKLGTGSTFTVRLPGSPDNAPAS
jgi:two-component system, OmpR family, manganese sensing sensor histidine kinase